MLFALRKMEILYIQHFLFNTTVILLFYRDSSKGKVIVDSVITATPTIYSLHVRNISSILNAMFFLIYVHNSKHLDKT